MGFRQQAFGSAFEDLFFNLCARVPGMAITRFPDGCRVIGRNRLVRVKTPCDWILTFGGVSALIDTKSSAGPFPHSKIEAHQVHEMLKHSQSGAKSGYVIWMRKTDDVVFYNSLILSQLMVKRGSIKAPLYGGANWLGKSNLFRPKMIFGVN